MSRVSVSGWALIIEREDGIWFVGIKDKIICLMNLDSLLVSNICLYYKETVNQQEIIRFFSERFNNCKIDPEVEKERLNFDVVQIEIIPETNELFFV